MADSTQIAQGGATVSVGSDLGYVKDGVTVTPTIDVYFVETEQTTTPVKAYRSLEKFEAEFTTIEPTLDRIRKLWELEDSISSPGAPTPDTVAFGTNFFTPAAASAVLTGMSTLGGTRTMYLLKTRVSTVPPLKFTKAEEQSLNVTLAALIGDGVQVGQYSDAS